MRSKPLAQNSLALVNHDNLRLRAAREHAVLVHNKRGIPAESVHIAPAKVMSSLGVTHTLNWNRGHNDQPQRHRISNFTTIYRARRENPPVWQLAIGSFVGK